MAVRLVSGGLTPTFDAERQEVASAGLKAGPLRRGEGLEAGPIARLIGQLKHATLQPLANAVAAQRPGVG